VIDEGHPAAGRVPLLDSDDRESLSEPTRTLFAMRPARPIVLLLLAVLSSAALAGCAHTTGPRTWASLVCTALAPWRAEISTLTDRTQEQMTAETSPAQAKENLTRLFGGAETASERARAGVAKAGVPDVDQGEQVAHSFTAALGGMRDAYGRARTGIEALATSPQKVFYDNVGVVVKKLNAEYEQSSLDTGKLSSVELKQAFDEVPECR
jgi:outer membrane murein-binding lipoprotein Lpp